MDAKEYKIKTTNPCAFSMNVLEETLRVLKAYNSEEVSVIEKTLMEGGIEKPDHHNIKDGYDYYWVKCTEQEAETIASYLFDAEAMAVSPSGETTPDASRYAHLADIWTNFRDWIRGL
jgi:hypothetical protein